MKPMMPSTGSSLPPLLDIDGLSKCLRPPFGAFPDEPGDERANADVRAATRILVVEDDWFVGTDMEAALQEAGYEVLELVVSATEAIQAAGKYKPDLILMDIRLSGSWDGVDAAVEIRRQFDIPCLFVTAHGDPDTRLRAEAARPVGWLTKPISNDALIAAVKQASTIIRST